MSDAETPKLRIGPGVAAGVDEALIARQVHAFYGRVRKDPALGPVFEAAVEDWDEHLAKLCDFWSSVLLMTGRFKGSPMAAHAQAPGVLDEHFALWLDLFERTARDICPPAAAELFIEKSRMIGRSLRMGLAASRGTLIADLTAR
ncbi:MAG: group III truncated hemoglobin [Phenylobacterium sp.]|uniref:group III truncated hemoglobin n=1 Tax=Phenylobacterium sp. TaxID=1871053 RepID=UPI0012219BAC|nr:group III truncated hemoglobin [Phenylobacterium sp.]TAJ72006.1 MAG: group III truncated hemoglobin [Phenylobacterium sp.]